MKKWMLISATLFNFAIGYADSPERVEMLSAKAILGNTNGYFVLTDKSCWKAIGFSKRWRTVGEWWNNVQLVPQNYECVPNDWYLGAQIEVYSKYGNLEVNEANASNQDVLKNCTHLLFNKLTGQVLFAVALEPAECIVQLFRDAHEDGYQTGFAEGRSKSNQATQDVLNKSYSDGYKAGYTDGLKVR